MDTLLPLRPSATRRVQGIDHLGGSMGTEDDGVLEAARAIRPYLTDLVVGQDAAGLLDRQIAGHLTGGADRSETVRRLRTLLEEQEDTRWFLTEVLADVPHHRPPYQQPRHRQRQPGMASPAGDTGPILHTGIYTCPDGDYVWYRPEVGTPIPDCPTPHHGPLTRT